jgi:hypothetical protein
MKYIKELALVGAMLGMAGCATTPKVAVSEPVGPAPTQFAEGAGNGSLIIFSAHRRANVDVNMAEWRWNNDFGKNAFLYEPARTGYTIYGKNGQVFKEVRNAIGTSDSTPTVVKLPAGTYQVKAQGINCEATRVQVLMTVVIEPGETTVAHLSGRWQPMGEHHGLQVARLPCGKAIGWRAPEAGYASAQPNS